MQPTEEIIEMLKREGKDYFLKNKPEEIHIGLYLEALMEERGITRREMLRSLNVEESYGRKMLGGQRMPTRKILLKSAFLLGLNLEETQNLLDMGQKPRLYSGIRYDLALIYGIEEKMNPEELNMFLEEIEEEPLL